MKGYFMTDQTQVELIKRSRDKVETARDVLLDFRPALEEEVTQDIFEAAFPDTMAVLNTEAKVTLYNTACNAEGPLLSIFNEYAAFAKLAYSLINDTDPTFTRPLSGLAADILEANNPVGQIFNTIRAHKNLSDGQLVNILEAGFPLATNGLSEETRDYLFQLALDRGITNIEIANSYIELIDLVVAVRFLEDAEEEEYEEV